MLFQLEYGMKEIVICKVKLISEKQLRQLS